MRIVHVLPEFDLERKYHEYYLAKYQAAAGHEVFVLTTKHGKYQAGKEEVDGFTIIRLPRFFSYSDFVLARGVKSALISIMPDIVHAHDTTQGFQVIPALYKKKLGYRYIIDQHKYSLTIRTSLLVKLEYLLVRRWIASIAYRRADHIVAIVPTAIDFIKRYHPEYTRGISFIPLGFDPKIFYADSELRQKVRTDLGISHGAIVIITSGSIQAHKKVTDVILALDKLKSYNIHLIIVGKISHEYKRYLNTLPFMSTKVHFVAYKPEDALRGYYSAADIAFWNYPTISILSAMGCGCIPLVSDDPTTKFYQGLRGFYFQRGNILSLVNALTKIITSDMQIEKKRVIQQAKPFIYRTLVEEYAVKYLNLMRGTLN